MSHGCLSSPCNYCNIQFNACVIAYPHGTSELLVLFLSSRFPLTSTSTLHRNSGPLVQSVLMQCWKVLLKGHSVVNPVAQSTGHGVECAKSPSAAGLFCAAWRGDIGQKRTLLPLLPWPWGGGHLLSLFVSAHYITQKKSVSATMAQESSDATAGPSNRKGGGQ